MHPTFACKCICLYIFRYLSGGSAGIGIHASQTGMYGTQCYSLVS